jgi:hypothetical protein
MAGNPRSKAVADAQAKVLRAGGERLTLTLPAADAARWRALVARQGPARGAKMAAFRAALALAEGQAQPTNTELVALIARRLGGARSAFR